MAYTGRNEALYYSSPEEVVTKGNFQVEDIRPDWTNGTNEADLDAYLIIILQIVKDIIDRDRNINFSLEENGVPETIHMVGTLLGYFFIKDTSDTQDSYIKNSEEIRIYTSRKMFDENTRSLLNLIPKRVVSGKHQNGIRIKAITSGVSGHYDPSDVLRWR